MNIDLNNLPSEPNILHQIITNLVDEVISLQDQLALLKARRFGKSFEKLDKQIEELEQRVEANELDTPYKDKDEEVIEKPQNRPKRLKIPEDLPREDIIINPDPECPDCGSQEFRKIEDDISETLEYVPASFKVIRHIRSRCACTNCKKIVQAFATSKTIDKGEAGPGLLAHILVQKYCNHLPMYRQKV